ncbi:galactose-specific lectin nattectin-like [Argopecten irradians]|uniref:galactose-specific lectin nattectin-like n=1 Tax=Argopecten irradians TaxID=31199 RepID=UPI0037144A97
MSSVAVLTLPLLLLCLHLAATQTDVSRCPINLQRGPSLQGYEGKCYLFETHHHRDWAHANNDCRAKGGKLLTIHSSGEQNFIMSALGSLNFQGNGVWLGLTDQATEGTFVWADGSPVDFVYWANGQPGGLGGIASSQEDCALLKYRDSGHWHDYPCSSILFIQENYGWVCKFDMLPMTTRPVVMASTPSPDVAVSTQSPDMATVV